MGKQQKAKTNRGERNSERKNGKAYKSSNIRHRCTRLSAVDKINLFNGGMYANVAKRWAENA